ncbi:MAG: Fe(3+) ABC transporter substrate-binding protein [Alphaproteobacteria bacterium]|nr:Fe(3+) ABC transporter substrate-binding protein [Alphaproteobacteria bacterium]
MTPTRLTRATLALAGGLGLAAASAAAADEVNVYSSRQEYLSTPFFDGFAGETGITVNTVYFKQGMMERLQAEGANSPADLVMTVDIASLQAMTDARLFQPVESSVLEANVPAQFRGSDGLWFGLTTRARVIYYAKDRVAPAELSTYLALAEDKWRGRICMRSAHHDYNRALIAAVILHYGEPAAEQWLRGLKANLARRPQGNDRDQVRAIKEGVCDLALGNTYYMAKMMADPEQKPWAEAVAIFFPDQGANGTHVNVSGAAIARYAPNRDAAIRLLEYLSSDDAQRLYAEANFEYPVKPGVAWAPIVESWGRFTADATPLSHISLWTSTATMLIDRVGFDE